MLPICFPGSPMRLTRPNIARLVVPPGKSELIVFDDALPGFGIRLRSSGTRVWIAQYRTGTKQRRVTLGSVEVLDPDEARRAAKTTLARAQLGADPPAEKAAAKVRATQTLGSSIESYLMGHAKGRLKVSTLRDVSRYLRVSWRSLHELPLHQVDRRAIASCLSVIAAESGGTSANRARTTLSAFFSWAMREGLADVNPTIGTHIFDEQTRERVLTDDEIAAVWKACRGDHYGSIVKLLILTGQRRLEIGEVVRSEIDFPGRRIRLPGARTKNGQPHDVPLADAALLLVADMLTSHGRELLFGYGDGPFQGWSKCKARLDRDAGIAPWRLHDLRRTVATGMAELGVLPHVVEAVLNHASGHKAGVAGVYNRALYSAEKRNALELWARHVTSLVDLGEPSSGKILQIGGAD